MATTLKKSISEQLEGPVGHNLEDIRAWVRARRPDLIQQIEMASGNDGLMALMAIGYSAGRCSVVAELDGTTTEETARLW
jgi:hypothetical protein